MTRNALRIRRVKPPEGYDVITDSNDSEKIETHIHGRLTVTEDNKGIQRLSLISEGDQ